MRKREKRTRKFTVRFTETEYTTLERKFRTTTSSQMSQYIRNAVISRPLVIKYRNESLDQFMEELIQLKQELNAIGNNFNQAVKALKRIRVAGPPNALLGADVTIAVTKTPRVQASK